MRCVYAEIEAYECTNLMKEDALLFRRYKILIFIGIKSSHCDLT